MKSPTKVGSPGIDAAGFARTEPSTQTPNIVAQSTPPVDMDNVVYVPRRQVVGNTDGLLDVAVGCQILRPIFDFEQEKV